MPGRLRSIACTIVAATTLSSMSPTSAHAARVPDKAFPTVRELASALDLDRVGTINRFIESRPSTRLGVGGRCDIGALLRWPSGSREATYGYDLDNSNLLHAEVIVGRRASVAEASRALTTLQNRLRSCAGGRYSGNYGEIVLKSYSPSRIGSQRVGFTTSWEGEGAPAMTRFVVSRKGRTVIWTQVMIYGNSPRLPSIKRTEALARRAVSRAG